MNTFETFLIGKEVLKILRVDFKEDYDEESLIGLFLQLDTQSGLFIENGTDDSTTLRYITLEELLEEFEDEYQAGLNCLKTTDPLNDLIGEKLQAIRLGANKPDKFASQSFVVTSSEHTEVQIEIGNLQITIFQKNRRQRITIIHTSTLP